MAIRRKCLSMRASSAAMMLSALSLEVSGTVGTEVAEEAVDGSESDGSGHEGEFLTRSLAAGWPCGLAGLLARSNSDLSTSVLVCAAPLFGREDSEEVGRWDGLLFRVLVVKLLGRLVFAEEGLAAARPTALSDSFD